MEFSLKNKALAEFIGTFVLVLGGCGTAIFGHVGFLGVAIAFGLTVVAMAYGVGHISGAHLNPAVSVGVLVNGRMTVKEFVAYVISQILGAIAAAAILFCIAKQAGVTIGVFAANGYGEAFQTAAGAENGYLNVSTLGAFITEAVLTFVFLIVILGATDGKKGAPAGFGGLAIGLTLTLIHLISIPLTNTSVNPARSISQAIFSEQCFACSELWLFIVAPCVGAALAGLCYKCLSCNGEGCGCCCKKD
ncbi:MAG: aquaporin [Paludibacteraceae bacterium]|jgi:aquaporin Z|nr:aquaporin [Paludibacteraceae bacterium]MCR5299132.1 aquaporin [Paludibacteraceae bacterium]